MILALLFFSYGILGRHKMAVVVGSVLILLAIIVWSFARRIAARSAQFDSSFKQSPPRAVTER
jgi:hypothetical protein